MRQFGLLGYPLSHSFSPSYFKAKFEKLGIDARYDLFPIEDASRLRKELEQVKNLEGFNVTIPHKQNILPFLDELSPEAKAIGAVNTVRIHANKWIGYNTDAPGFLKAIRPFLAIQHTHALILGSGGASKAVSYALKQLNIRTAIVSRSGGDLGYPDISSTLLNHYKLLVNCTPLGMSPKKDAMPDVPVALLNHEHLLVDLIYNPEETKLMRLAKKQGATAVNGSDMLINQADLAWEIWNQ
ncbi:MAG: shikimate dehydrogenase family protein [Luteibaculum sp.]